TSPSTAATRQPHSFPTRRSSDLIAQEEIRCITQWFHDHNQAVRFEDFRTAFVCLDHVGSLDTYRKVSLKKPGHNRHPLGVDSLRSEEHTSELQSRENLVCRLLLE